MQDDEGLDALVCEVGLKDPKHGNGNAGQRALNERFPHLSQKSHRRVGRARSLSSLPRSAFEYFAILSPTCCFVFPGLGSSSVDELDRQKLSNHKSAGGRVDLRTQARAALKTLDCLLQVDSTVPLTRRAVKDNRCAVYIQLLNNDLDHVALDDPDSEIIDRALTLRPFAPEVRLVTYDSAMAFRARHAGLDATKLTYD